MNEWMVFLYRKPNNVQNSDKEDDDGPRGTSGRARGARSAFYGDDGRLLAHADAVWVRPRAD